MLEIALRTHLLAQTTISSSVSQRVILADIGEDKEALPHIVFRTDDSDWQMTLDGESVDLQFPVVEFEIRAEAPADLVTLCDAIRRALLEIETGATISTTVGNVVIESVDIIDGGSDSSPKLIKRDENTIEVLRRSIMAQIGYRHNTAAVS